MTALKPQTNSTNNTLPDVLANTLHWFELAKPEPTNKDFHTQLGVHLEEVAEMLETLTPISGIAKTMLNSTRQSIERFATFLKENDDVFCIEPDQVEAYLDAICDQLVTGTGCAHIAKFQLIEALGEVNRANFSKFDEEGKPILDANRKVIKGPNYVPPNLKPFI